MIIKGLSGPAIKEEIEFSLKFTIFHEFELRLDPANLKFWEILEKKKAFPT